jgi:TPR repeat protein
MNTRLAVVGIAVISLCGPAWADAAGEADLEAAIGAAEDHRYEEAFRLFVRSAAAGNPVAQRTAGLMAFYGEHLYSDAVPRNYPVARQWLSVAARQGCEISRHLLNQLERQGGTQWLAGTIYPNQQGDMQ